MSGQADVIVLAERRACRFPDVVPQDDIDAAERSKQTAALTKRIRWTTVALGVFCLMIGLQIEAGALFATAAMARFIAERA